MKRVHVQLFPDGNEISKYVVFRAHRKSALEINSICVDLTEHPISEMKFEVESIRRFFSTSSCTLFSGFYIFLLRELLSFSPIDRKSRNLCKIRGGGRKYCSKRYEHIHVDPHHLHHKKE